MKLCAFLPGQELTHFYQFVWEMTFWFAHVFHYSEIFRKKCNYGEYKSTISLKKKKVPEMLKILEDRDIMLYKNRKP